MKSFTILLFTTITTGLMAQQLNTVATLGSTLEETSSLLYLDGRLLTINDASGDKNIYEIDQTTGGISRSVNLFKANNVDWESLAHDNDHIYVCDTGDDEGERDELKIYRVTKENYLNYDVIVSEVTKFTYPFLNGFDHGFNCEASVVIDDRIYLFTKAYNGEPTRVFSVPTEIGNYVAEFVQEIALAPRVTDASVMDNGQILVSQIDDNNNLTISRLDWDGQQFNISDQQSPTVPADFSGQIEGICPLDNGNFYLTREKSWLGLSGLFKFEWMSAAASVGEVKEGLLELYPNPTIGDVTLRTDVETTAVVYSALGQKVWEGEILPGANNIETSEWRRGVYLVTLDGEMESKTMKLLVK